MKESLNEICANCLKWEKFGEECWVHWEKKKECTQKVIDKSEWRERDLFLSRKI